jgi:GT2 family glycosyltransferase
LLVRQSAPERSDASAIIVNYESGDRLVECVGSLRGQPGLIETIVVDNGSTDGSAAAALARFPDVVLVEPGRNLGFAAGANAGAHVASGRLLLFLNPDVELSPRTVERLASAFGSTDVAVAGPKIELDRLGTFELGSTIDPLGYPVPLSVPRPPLYVSGCALMTRSDLFTELGGFDERFFMFVEDVDYCWRALLLGLDVRVVPDALARHHGGASAPGGYITREGLSTTRFRVVLRERNTLAALLKCYAFPTLAAVLPAYIAQSLATAAALAASRRAATAIGVLSGLWWNACELPRTLAMRREIQRSRAVRERDVLGRMHRGVQKLTLLRRFGVPPVDQSETAPSRPAR